MANSTLKEKIAIVPRDVKKLIDERMDSFKEKWEKRDEWFSELCFCILTANSSAKIGIKIQNEIDFVNLSKEEISKELKRLGYRFYNRRAEFIIAARKFSNLKEILANKDGKEMREWLVKNVKGIGYKEASHFLRNVGVKGLAILDRHILKNMCKNGLIDEIPAKLNKRKYLEIEKILEEVAKSIGMDMGELDLYLWWMETGKVLK